MLHGRDGREEHICVCMCVCPLRGVRCEVSDVSDDAVKETDGGGGAGLGLW